MTLSSTSINQFAEKLYMRFLRDETLSPDACSDMYDQFVRRMKDYRKKHPDRVKVSDAFVRQCEDWIVRNFMLAEKRKKNRWELECELAKEHIGADREKDSYPAAFALLKLEALFNRWLEREPKAGRCLEIFLLHHAYYLNGRLLKRFIRLVPSKKSEFVRRVKKVKRVVAERFAEKAEKSMSAAHLWYCRSLKQDLHARDAETDKRARHLALRDECARRQHRALERASRLKPYPKFTELASICNTSERNVRYALSKCKRKIAALAAGE